MEVFRSDVKAGIFITVAAALFLFAVFKVGGILEKFNKSRSVTIAFKNAQQVEPGTEVLFRGIKIGRVEKVLLATEGEDVHMLAELDPGYPLLAGTRAKILPKSLLGGKVIELVPPARPTASPSLLADGEIIQGISSSGLTALIDSLDALIPKYQVKADEVFSKLFLTIENLDKAINEAREGAQGLAQVGPTAIEALNAYRGLATELEPELKKVLAKLDAAADAVPKDMDRMASDFGALSADLRQQIDAVGGDLRTVLGRADRLLIDTDGLVRENREDLTASIASLKRSLAHLEAFSERIAQRPSSLVWSKNRNKKSKERKSEEAP